MRSPLGSVTFEKRLCTVLSTVGWVFAVFAAGCLVIAVFQRWDRQIASAEDLRVRVFLSLILGAVTAGIARSFVFAGRVFPRAAVAGLVAWTIAVTSSASLVWTSLKISPMLWRVWWLSLVLSLAAALAMALRLPATGRRGRVEKAAAGCLVLLAMLLMTLAARSDVLATPHPVFLWSVAVLLAVVVIGSVIARFRSTRGRPRPPLPRWRRFAWVISGQAAIAVTAFFVGRLSAPEPPLIAPAVSEMTTQTPEQIEAELDLNMSRLRALSAALADLRQQSDALHAKFSAARAREDRTYYTPEEADQIRPLFMSYLATRAGLLRLITTYAQFAQVRDERLKSRCFLVGLGAGSMLYAHSLRLMALGEDPTVRQRLNEAEASWDLPAGRFDEIRRAVASEHTFALYQEMAAYYDARKEQWRSQHLLPAEQMQWITGEIDRWVAQVRLLDIDRDKVRWEMLANRVRGTLYNPLYTLQSTVSTWIGDTRLVARRPFISAALIKSIQPQLRPGDILLERRNWFASNAFLPGFWPHAALYVGTPEELEQLGILQKGANGTWTSDNPQVAARLQAYLRNALDGEPNTVIESVSEGVIFNSLTHSMAADYVAVLRPRKLSALERAAAICKAFGHEGKPYDFQFDFATSDKLVCTELVYQCYDDKLDFDCDPSRPGEQLPFIMGRNALPAVEFCHKFARERSSEQRDFDLVLFLDAVPHERTARLADAEEFVASARRPRGFNE